MKYLLVLPISKAFSDSARASALAARWAKKSQGAQAFVPLKPEDFDGLTAPHMRVKVADSWNKNMKMKLSDFAEVVSGDSGVKTGISAVLLTGFGHTEICVDMALENQGARIGRTQRTLSFSDEGRLKYVHNDLFKLNKEVRGQGYAKRMLGSQIAQWKKMGATGVYVDASLDNGGYTWAKFGFKPVNDGWKQYVRGNLKYMMEHGDLPFKEIDATEKMLAAPNALWMISDLHKMVKKAMSDDEIPLGKRLLNGSDWSGRLDFADHDSMDRFDRYTQKKEGKK